MSRTHAKKRSTTARRKYVPKRYQRRSIKFGIERPRAGFFLAPGLGKTSIILFIFKILKALGIVDTLFILAKKTICFEVWPKEIKKWKGLEKLRYSIVHGNRTKKLRKKADVFIMNYEGLEWLSEKEQRWFFEGRKIMLAVDESSKLRNTSTLRFKSLKSMLHRFERRYILTGSPAPNGLMNLFGQVYVLDMGKRLGKFITHFRNEFFRPCGYMAMEWKPQKGAEKRIFKKLKPIVLRYGHDQLDLPPLTFVDIKVTLPAKAMKLYKRMEKELIFLIKDGAVVAANAAVASGKCRQIANGAVFYTKEGDIAAVDNKKHKRKWKAMHDAKLEALVELLEELQGEPALVAFEYKHDKERIKKYLAKHAPQFKNAPFVDGSIKRKELKKLMRAWDEGEIPVMFAHPETAAYGLNLQGKGGIVIFFALTWNLENYEQFYQRVWRQGQKRRVIVYRIVAKNTVDGIMINSLKVKDAGQQRLLKAMEKRYGQAATRKKRGRREERRGRRISRRLIRRSLRALNA